MSVSAELGPYLRVKEAATVARVSEATIWRALRAKRLRACRPTPDRVVIAASDLKQWIERGQAEEGQSDQADPAGAGRGCTPRPGKKPGSPKAWMWGECNGPGCEPRPLLQ